jgi:hypothetical protein
MTVQVNMLGNCCGFNVLYGFHDVHFFGPPPQHVQKEDIERFKNYVLTRKNLSSALYVAITEDQDKWYGNTIREEGFQLLSSNYRNPNTGARLHLYERVQFKWDK